MNYRFRDIPAMLTTAGGRIQLKSGIHYRAFPLLAFLAGLYRRVFLRRVRLTVVIGSFGKSTTTRMVSAALDVPLHDDYHYNSFAGVAFSVFRLRPWQKRAVIEVGIANFGQMIRYARITKPDVVVVTSIGSEGIVNLRTIDAIRDEKSLMVRALSSTGTAVLNGDDSNVMWMAENTKASIVKYGFSDGCDVRGSDFHLNWPEGSQLTARLKEVDWQIHTRTVGRHMAYPALAALAVANLYGMDPGEALFRMAQVMPGSKRLERFELPGGATLLSDEQKSTLETIYTALDVLADLPEHRRIVVIGDLSEAPGDITETYVEIGERIAQCAEHMVVVGYGLENYSIGATRAGMPDSHIHDGGNSPQELEAVLRPMLKKGDVLLTKARKGQMLERLRLLLQGEDVKCSIPLCDLKALCPNCPMLKTGWEGKRFVLERGLREPVRTSTPH